MHRYHDPAEQHHHHHHHHHAAVGGRRRWWIVWLLPPALLFGYLATGIFTVQPDEVAAVRRCGRQLERLRGPGLHFGLPYGMDRVDKIKPMQMKRVGVGVGLAERSTGRRLQPRDAEGLTGDRNLILISAIVQYRIANAKDYLVNTANVTRLIEATAATTLTGVISSMEVDHVLTTKRIEVQTIVRQQLLEALRGYQAGVEIVSVSLEGTAPPQEVSAAFRDVTSAFEDKQRAENEAKGYRDRLLPQARGEAERIRLEAEAYATKVVRTAQGDASRFTQMAAQLEGRRELTMRRYVLEAMEQILPRLEKIVLDADAGQQLDLGIFADQQQQGASP
jgi:membrane protease subunit HflK